MQTPETGLNENLKQDSTQLNFHF